MIYLGLDISLNRTGWFVFTDDNMRVLGYGAVEHSTRKDEGEKLNNLYSEIDNVIKKYNPDGCGIEAEFVGQNRKTALKLGHCHGVTMLALKQNNIPFTYYSVMTLKSEVVEGINLINDNGLKKTGSELKAEVQNAILDIFGKEQFTVPYKTDETDAASAAYIYYKFKGVTIDNIKKKQKNTEKKKKEKEKIKRKVKKMFKREI